MKAQFERGKGPQRATGFRRRNLRTGQVQTASFDAEGENLPFTNDVLRQRPRNRCRNRRRFDFSDRETLLKAERFIEGFGTELAEVHKMLAETGRRWKRCERGRQRILRESPRAYQNLSQLTFMREKSRAC